MIHITLTDRQAEFLEMLMLNHVDVSVDSTVRRDARAIQRKIQKEWDALADYHE